MTNTADHTSPAAQVMPSIMSMVLKSIAWHSTVCQGQPQRQHGISIRRDLVTEQHWPPAKPWPLMQHSRLLLTCAGGWWTTALRAR
jgi:hypothetical protein